MNIEFIDVRLSRLEIEVIRESILDSLLGDFCGESYLKILCRTYQLKTKESLLEYFIENGDERDFACFDLYFRLGGIVTGDLKKDKFCNARWFIMNIIPEECLYKEGD
jgi:hypothetical protein